MAVRRLLILVAVLVLAGVIRLLAATSSHSGSPKFTATEVAKTARDIGRDPGEPDPTEISEVSTTYGNAARVATFGRARHREEPDGPVYVVARCTDTSPVRSHRLPEGRLRETSG